MEAFQTALKQAKAIVAIAGAGLSAGSGIPTFRGAGGLWRSYDAMKIATPEAFAADPSRVWQFYHMRREKALQAQPNIAHLALATLSIPQALATISPSAKFTLITQNVDGLSPRALRQVTQASISQGVPEPPTRNAIFEMHGRLFQTLCTSCNAREPNYDSPICEALRGTELIVEKHQPEPQIPLEHLPRCKSCGGLLRPDVVWFGETPYHLPEIDDIINEADLALVVGTSSTVYPAASYAYQVLSNGGKIAVFNLVPSEGEEDATFLFLGPCEETLPQALFGKDQAALMKL